MSSADARPAFDAVVALGLPLIVGLVTLRWEPAHPSAGVSSPIC
jgi:hypothetical protein